MGFFFIVGGLVVGGLFVGVGGGEEWVVVDDLEVNEGGDGLIGWDVEGLLKDKFFIEVWNKIM